MYLNNFNSIYLRPTGVGQYDEFADPNKVYTSINDAIYYPNLTATPPIQYYNSEILGVNNNQNIKLTYGDGTVTQSWKFEQPTFNGTVDQLHIWILMNHYMDAGFGGYEYPYAPNIYFKIYTSGSWFNPNGSEKKQYLDFPPGLDRYWTAYNNPSMTGTFRWFQCIFDGPFTSSEFANFEIGLKKVSMPIMSEIKIDAIYAELRSSTMFPLYISGVIASINNSIPLYTQSNDAEISVPLYTHGRGIIHSGYFDMFVDGIQRSTTSLPMCVSGIPNEYYNSLPLYTTGPVQFDGSVDLLLYNNNPFDNSVGLYAGGLDYNSGELPLYTFGAYLSNTSMPMFMVGPSGIESPLNLFTEGFMPTPTSTFCNLFIQQSSIFLHNGWYSYNKLYDHFDEYVGVSKDRVKYGTPPFTNSTPYSGIYEFFRPYESGNSLPTYEPGKVNIGTNGEWLGGVFVSGVTLGPINGPGIAWMLPYGPFNHLPHRTYFTPYTVPFLPMDSRPLYKTFEHYLEFYLDPYGLINFNTFIDNYLMLNHSGYLSMIQSWNGQAFTYFDPNQLYMLIVNSGVTYNFMPVLPKEVCTDIVASSIAYVESLTNPHHPYTFPMTIQAGSPFLTTDGWTSYNKLYDNYDLGINSIQNMMRTKRGTETYYVFDGHSYTNPNYSGIYDYFKAPSYGQNIYPVAQPSYDIAGDGDWNGGIYVSGHILTGSAQGGFGALAGYGYIGNPINTVRFTPYLPKIGVLATSGPLHKTVATYLEEYDLYDMIDFDNFVENFLRARYPYYMSVIDSWTGYNFSTGPTTSGVSHSGIVWLSYNNNAYTNYMPTLSTSVVGEIVASSIYYVQNLKNPHHLYAFPIYTKGLSYESTGVFPLFQKVSLGGQANVKDIDDILPFYMTGLGIRGSGNRGFSLYLNQTETYAGYGRQFYGFVHSEQPIYTTDDTLNLSVWNSVKGVYSGIPLYVKNIRDGISEFDPEFFTLVDNSRPFNGTRSLYVHNGLYGKELGLYLKVFDAVSGGMPMYTMGGHIGQSGINLYTKAYGSPTHKYNLYTHGF